MQQIEVTIKGLGVANHYGAADEDARAKVEWDLHSYIRIHNLTYESMTVELVGEYGPDPTMKATDAAG